MKKRRYYLVDVFTREAFGGNPLAVFPDGRGLSAKAMQSIAREFNLSETTFVFPPVNGKNDFRVRIFTPDVELPMAGHPTIGTAFALAHAGLIKRSPSGTTVKFEEGVGVIDVDMAWKNGAPADIWMSQPLPVFGPAFPDLKSIAEMLSTKASAITDTGLPVEAVSCGVPFLFVPLKGIEDVRGLQFRVDVWKRILRGHEAPHVFTFAMETENKAARVHCRMFAPALGITEDPATGGASGPLGCYIVRRGLIPPGRNGDTEFLAEQGLEMGRPSFIKVRIGHEGGEVKRVRVGGECRLMGEGHLFI